MEDTTKTTSPNDLATAFYFNFAVGVVVFLGFAVVRPYFKNVYFPKTYMVDQEKRAPSIKPGLFGWMSNVLSAKDKEILRITGLDNFMFLKFLRNFLYLFGGFSIFTTIVLIPLNVTGGGGVTGLGVLSSANISETQNDRLWAHLIFTYFFVGATIYICFFSMQEFVKLRHEYLTNPEYSKTLHARALFVGSIPDKLLNEKSLYKIFNAYPGGVKEITINKSSTKLDELVKKRNDIHNKLELAETKYITACTKAKRKVTRPSHFTGFLGRFGDKVDSIDYYHKELALLNASIENLRQNNESFPLLKSCFVVFKKQVAAHMAAQTIVSHRYLKMEPRHVGVRPSDMLWQNLNLKPLELLTRGVIGESLCIALGIFWFLPVGFVTYLSNLENLQNMKGLEWINDIPPGLKTFLQSILPAVLISVLNMLVPIIFAKISTYQGLPRKTDVTISVMKKFFWFLIITFLFGSTIFGSSAQIQKFANAISEDPKAIFTALSTALPSNSGFFITYVLLKALNAAAQEILAIADLLKRQLLTMLFITSPRSRLQLLDMKQIQWGQLWPENTLVFCIGAVYCTISPISNLFITLYFAIYYFVYRYQLMYVYDNSNSETGGLYFVQSIHQIYTGLYFLCIMMVGIMISYIEPVFIALSAVLLALVIISHYILGYIFGSHIRFLPTDLGLEVDSLDSPNPSDIGDEENPVELNQLQSDSISKGAEPIQSPSQDSQYNSVSFPTSPNDLASDHRLDPSSLSSHGLIPPAQKSSGLPYNSNNSSKKSFKKYFAHPSFSSPQLIVWIPVDEMGVYEEEAANLRKRPNMSSPYPLTELKVTNHSASIIPPKSNLQLREYSYPEENIDLVKVMDSAVTRSQTSNQSS